MTQIAQAVNCCIVVVRANPRRRRPFLWWGGGRPALIHSSCRPMVSSSVRGGADTCAGRAGRAAAEGGRSRDNADGFDASLFDGRSASVEYNRSA